MTKYIYEIQGKDGIIQIGEDWSLPNEEIANYFSYINNDIVFVYEEILDDTPWAFFLFQEDLRSLLSSSSYFQAIQALNKKPDSWFKKILKNKFSKLFSDEIRYNSQFLFQNPYGIVKIRKSENSSDYIIEFEMPDPYPFDISDDDEILFKGSLLVSEEALVNFYCDMAKQ